MTRDLILRLLDELAAEATAQQVEANELRERKAVAARQARIVGIGVTEIARHLRVSKPTVYAMIGEAA